MSVGLVCTGPCSTAGCKGERERGAAAVQAHDPPADLPGRRQPFGHHRPVQGAGHASPHPVDAEREPDDRLPGRGRRALRIRPRDLVFQRLGEDGPGPLLRAAAPAAVRDHRRPAEGLQDAGQGPGAGPAGLPGQAPLVRQVLSAAGQRPRPDRAVSGGALHLHRAQRHRRGAVAHAVSGLPRPELRAAVRILGAGGAQVRLPAAMGPLRRGAPGAVADRARGRLPARLRSARPGRRPAARGVRARPWSIRAATRPRARTSTCARRWPSASPRMPAGPRASARPSSASAATTCSVWATRCRSERPRGRAHIGRPSTMSFSSPRPSRPRASGASASSCATSRKAPARWPAR